MVGRLPSWKRVGKKVGTCEAYSVGCMCRCIRLCNLVLSESRFRCQGRELQHWSFGGWAAHLHLPGLPYWGAFLETCLPVAPSPS